MKLKEGYDDVDPQEIIKFCQDHLPHYMAPQTVILKICEKQQERYNSLFWERNGYGQPFLGEKKLYNKCCRFVIVAC